MAESEVAQLRVQIELVCQSMNQGLYGYATTARHAIIEHRYNQLGEHYEKLAQEIGDMAAIKVVTETLEKALKPV